MIRTSLVALAIGLVMISPDATEAGILETISQSLRNSALTIVGGFEFLVDYVEFSRSQVKDTTPPNEEEYDFIVVGAGSAGAAIASRLSEIDETKVLLIEAGSKEELYMDIPVAAYFLEFLTSINWDYYTEPSDSYSFGYNNNQAKIPYGKVLGGSSCMNFMMAVRGNKHNYDVWASETGDEGWSYDNFLKYLKKIEKFNSTTVPLDPKYHNFDGPVHINDNRYRTPLSRAFVEAGAELGFNAPIDYNGQSQTGFAFLQTNQIDGMRMSSNRAYLNPAKDRKNLVVSMDSQVDKVLIDPETKMAYGVEFTKSGEKIQVRAGKEVILSAGAINSPKILMLSGIGPAEHLQSNNISVLKDAPVGENMMDHIAYAGLAFLVNTTQTTVPIEFLEPSNPSVSLYLTKRDGPISLPSSIEAVGFVNVNDPSPDNEMPNIELIFASIQLGDASSFHTALNMRDDYYEKSFSGTKNKHGYLIFPTLSQPKSRGKVLLRSADPNDDPKVIPNYFDDPDDVAVGIKGIRMAIEIGKTNALGRFNSTMHEYIVPGCEKFQYDSDSYWECAYRTFPQTLWHYSGTCKMGREDDPRAVVNSKLQVKGIRNLRVADASIIPMVPAGHLNIPSMAIGEKLSDMLKSDWGYTL